LTHAGHLTCHLVDAVGGVGFWNWSTSGVRAPDRRRDGIGRSRRLCRRASSTIWRGSAIGVYRLWRDLGFAVGAVITGVIADAADMTTAIASVAVLTVGSGLIVFARMAETRPRP
jgi:hypothetical protein